jgi:hyperosmotically inducible periplasmic protein
MKTLILSCLLALAACSSDQGSQPPAASVQSEASSGSDTTAAQSTQTPRETIATPDSKRSRAPSEDHAEPSDNAAPAVADEHAANNTGVNKRDTQPAALTPGDQHENQSDLQITQKIRKAVMSDDSLSFTAKNAKIITQDGHVVLRGPVKSAAERTAIAGHASRIAGAHVDNQLEIEQ